MRDTETKNLKEMPEDYWKDKLSPEQYRILREAGTERAFTGELLHNKEDGTYRCAACNQPLFSSDTKFDSKSGWPSFFDVIDKGNIELEEDNSLGMVRTEIKCANCGSHLGHVFEDGPQDQTGLRYCINSMALDFKKSE